MNAQRQTETYVKTFYIFVGIFKAAETTDKHRIIDIKTNPIKVKLVIAQLQLSDIFVISLLKYM